MTTNALRLARDILERGTHYTQAEPPALPLARALLALHEENERLAAALKLAGTSVDDAYQHRSEYARLMHADVNQGRRIADLLADRDRLRDALAEALDGWELFSQPTKRDAVRWPGRRPPPRIADLHKLLEGK